MISNLYQTFIEFVALLMSKAADVYFSIQYGRKEERLENASKTNEAIHKGNNAIIRANTDDKLAMRLRDKYNLLK